MESSNIEGKPIRILQVVGKIAGGGVGEWLLNVLRHLEPGRFIMDFLVYAPEPLAVAEAIAAHGGRLIICPNPHRPWKFARGLTQVLREHGPYDVVHSHIFAPSGLVLRQAFRRGIPIRVVHSHADTSVVPLEKSESFLKGGMLRRLYLALMRRWLNTCGTEFLAVSRHAADDLFGDRVAADFRVRIMPCSIDLTAFQQDVDKAAVRQELGLPVDALVAGHVGRFVPQKNHEFLVEVAREAVKLSKEVYFLLVGEGPLRPKVEQQCSQSGLGGRVIFAGLRPDVPRLMLGAMDVLLLPSLYEGLPIVLLEAQAAGLPCLYSDVITEEVEVVRPLMRRLSLSQPAAFWAEALLAVKEANPGVTRQEALAMMERSPFNIVSGVKELERIYLQN